MSAIRTFRRSVSFPSNSAEAAFLRSLERAPLRSNETRRRLFNRWQAEKDISVMQELVEICVTQQARRLLKKKNVGEDLLDILHDAVVGILEEFERETPEDVSSLAWKALFSALRARQMHAMRTRRIVRAPVSRESRAAVSLLLETPLDELEDHEAHWFEAPAREAEVGARALERIWSLLAQSDTDEIPEKSAASHEDACLTRHDLGAVLGSIDKVLDARSAEVLRRRWLEEEEAEVIAADLGISDARVRQIDRAAIRALQETFAADSMDENRREVAGKARLKAQAGKVVLRPVGGVDLARAEPICGKMLHPLQEKVLRARFLSGSEVVPIEDVAEEMGLKVADVLAVQRAGLDRLRLEFPEAMATRDEKRERRYGRLVKAVPKEERPKKTGAKGKSAAQRKSSRKTATVSKSSGRPATQPAFDRGPLRRCAGKATMGV